MSASDGSTTTIRTRGLVKTFGSTRALDGLDLEVRAGEIHGFLGPNGAGKSTTIRILLGLIRRTAGEARLFDADPWADATELHGRLAYVPGDVALWPSLTGGQCLDLLAAANGKVSARRRAELVDRFDLDPTKRARDYSRGNRQKVALVAALAADVDLLVLDEPTAGLDPLMEQHFQQVVRARRDDGCTVLLSSHILAEVEALADRVSIIRRGRTVTSGSLVDLRRHTRTAVQAVTTRAAIALDDVPGVADLTTETHDGHVATRLTIDAEHLDEVIGRLHDARLHSLTVRPPSLDALFLRSYREGSDDPAGTEPR